MTHDANKTPLTLNLQNHEEAAAVGSPLPTPSAAASADVEPQTSTRADANEDGAAKKSLNKVRRGGGGLVFGFATTLAIVYSLTRAQRRS